MKITKTVKIVSIVIIILIALSGVLFLAKYIVDNSYSSSILVEDDKNKDKKETPSDPDIKLFKSEDAEDGLSQVESLYNDDDMSARQSTYVEGKYEKDFLDSIHSDSKEYLKDLGNINDIDVKNYSMYTIELLDILDREVIDNGSDCIALKDSLTVIGLYDNTSVLYAYNMSNPSSKTLLYVDYSDSLISTDSTDVFDFGDVKTLSIYPNICKLVEKEGYLVIYTRG